MGIQLGLLKDPQLRAKLILKSECFIAKLYLDFGSTYLDINCDGKLIADRMIQCSSSAREKISSAHW